MMVETVGRVESLGRLDLLVPDYSASPVGEMEAYLELDTETADLEIGWTHQSDNAVPMRVWHGRDRRYSISSITDGEVLTERINAGEVDDLVQRICAGTETVWDGSNFVARVSHDAVAAEAELQAWLDGADEVDGCGGVQEASEWLSSCTNAEVRVSSISTDADLEQIAARLEREADRVNTVLVDIIEELEARRQAARDECEED
jgi:hypothetical protein